MEVPTRDLNWPSTHKMFHIGDTPVEDLSQGPGVQRRQYNGGRMDGFVAAYRRLGQDGTTAMGHYDGTDLPFHWNVADEYVLFDRFFASTKVGGREPGTSIAGNAQPQPCREQRWVRFRDDDLRPACERHFVQVLRREPRHCRHEGWSTSARSQMISAAAEHEGFTTAANLLVGL